MKKIAPIFVFTAGVLWGSMGIFVRTLNAKSLVSMEIVALRAIVTTMALVLFLLFYDRSAFKIKIKDLWIFIGSGIGSILFFNFCYFKAIAMTSLSVAAILLYTAPAMVMVMSYFLFNEKFSKRKVFALILTFIGCVFVTGVIGDAQSVSGTGILVGLGAGLGYALYSIFSRFAIERGYTSFAITFYTFLFAAFGSVVFVDMGKVTSVAIKSTGMVIFSILFGIICTVAPYLLYTIGLKYVENSKASIIASVEPVAATVIGFAVFHEKIGIMGIVGIVFVLLGMEMCYNR